MPTHSSLLTSHPDNQLLHVVHEGGSLSIAPPEGGVCSHWQLHESDGVLGLAALEPAASEQHLLAALEAAFTWHPDHRVMRVDATIPASLRQTGSVSASTGGTFLAHRDALWQEARLWSPEVSRPRALQHVLTGALRHPRRPEKPSGTVYRRWIPWLGRTLSLRAIDPHRDLDTFHRWMNDPVVNHFWQEQGDVAAHRTYLDRVATDPHTTALVGSFDDTPFGYFEVYWAREDRISQFCDAGDFDRGWHVLIGEPAFRGRPFLTAWMPSVSHHLFLDDSRTQRVVIEPRIDNDKIIRSLARCGYALLKEFDFPHKRAMLGMLLRERFFADALWIPRHPPT